MLVCCVDVFVLRVGCAGVSMWHDRVRWFDFGCNYVSMRYGNVCLGVLSCKRYVLDAAEVHTHSGPPACDFGVVFAGAGSLCIDAVVRSGRCATHLAVVAMVRRHQWSSGRIHRCHRCDPGSIPG